MSTTRKATRRTNLPYALVIEGGVKQGSLEPAFVLDPIRNESLHQRVYDRLRAAFLEGRFLPGQIITMRTLAEMTATSVQPVREALQRLCGEGVVEWSPSKSIQVPLIDARRYSELWSIRILLEGAAVRRASPHVSADDIAALRRLNRTMAAAARTGDAVTTLRLNREFHFAIYAMARSPVLLSLIEAIWMQVSPLFAAFAHQARDMPGIEATEHLRPTSDDFLKRQGEIVDALDARREEAAVKALELILETSARLFRPVVQMDSQNRAGTTRRNRHA